MRNKKKGKVAKAILAAAVIAPAVAVSPISIDGGHNTAEASSSFDYKQNNGNGKGNNKGNGSQADKLEKKADQFEKQLEKKTEQIEKQINKHTYNPDNRGSSLLQLANKAVHTGEPTPVHSQGKVIGYVVADVKDHQFDKSISFKFVRDLPQPPVEDVEEQQPIEEVETPVEDPIEVPEVDETVVDEELPSVEVEIPVQEEQPLDEVEDPVVEDGSGGPGQDLEEPSIEDGGRPDIDDLRPPQEEYEAPEDIDVTEDDIIDSPLFND